MSYPGAVLLALLPVLLAAPSLAEAHTDFIVLAEHVRLLEAGVVPGSDEYPRILEYDPASNQYLLRAWRRDSLNTELKLTSVDRLENAYFRIVEFRVLKEADDGHPYILNEEPLPIGDYDGQNALFHLMKARAFFQRLSPGNPALRKKITVRVRANRVYNAESHTGDVPLANVSAHLRPHRDGLWDQEIWFHVRKGGFLFSKPGILDMSMGAAISLLSGPAWSVVSVPLSLVPNRWSGVDYVKNPSAVYHEAFHWASNDPDLLPVQRSSHPLSENLAYYFGSSIEGAPRYAGVGSSTDRRAMVRYDRLKPVRRGHADLDYDFTGFIPSFLWNLRLKGYLSPEETDRAAWRIVELANLKSWPSDFPAYLLAALEGHPNRPQITRLLKDYECSFHNQNERFAEFYYWGIHGLSTPERPLTCQRGVKKNERGGPK